MARLYACIVSPSDPGLLVNVAQQFASSIEVIEDGVLFDVSGLERLIGKPERVSQKIFAELRKKNLAGGVAVAESVDTAQLLARSRNSSENTASASLVQPDIFEQLPISGLDVENDTLNVFSELGLRTVKDLLAVPHDALIGRYGRSFRDVIDVIEQKGRSFVTPNVKENTASWHFELDLAVEDFEQLIFLLNHGLERLFAEVGRAGFSTEQLDISFRLSNKTRRDYEIKTSFPTIERNFWLKLINLRIALDPPEASIAAVDVTAHFTRHRPDQRGLYAVSRPEPESMTLTVNKVRNLVGESNVGVPQLLNDRLTEPFTLDADAIPAVKSGKLSADAPRAKGVIAFKYFRPPMRAEVLVRDARLVYIKTHRFLGYVANFSGVWKRNSHWWDTPSRSLEWDVEIENGGVYRLSKTRGEWFVTGEYD